MRTAISYSSTNNFLLTLWSILQQTTKTWCSHAGVSFYKFALSFRKYSQTMPRELTRPQARGSWWRRGGRRAACRGTCPFPPPDFGCQGGAQTIVNGFIARRPHTHLLCCAFDSYWVCAIPSLKFPLKNMTAMTRTNRSTWVFRPPARVSSAEIDAMSRAQAVPNVDPVSSHRTTEGSSSCNRAGRSNHIGGAEFTVSTQRIKDDSSVDASFEDETEGGVASAGGGGGGGGRVGSLPSFPRTLPATSTKAPLNKKFAWVP
ncbi:unnamed protein product [Pylaiella littoralis]